MPKLPDLSVYRPIVATKPAWLFDAGAFFMRIYTFMVTIGAVSMLTLSGNSVFLSGTVSSVIALATFLISPRVSKLIDERGQSAVIPFAAAIALAGLALLLCVTSFGLPFWLSYGAGVMMGFIPNASAVARTRWTYLVKARGEEFGLAGMNLKTVFSYEGILDDIAFMIGPAASVALSASFFPAAGLLFGGVMYALGAVLLLSSRRTEPQVGWSDAGGEGEEGPAEKADKRSVFRISKEVRLLFFLMFLLGSTYGVMDTATVTFGQELGIPLIASVSLMGQAAISVVSGFFFGATRFKASVLKQLRVVCTLLGCAYACLLLVRGLASFLTISIIAAVFYAPFLITCNTACEKSVSGARLTEAMTWTSSGLTFGLAVGPTIAGSVVDAFGSIAGFSAAAAFAVIIPVLVNAGSRGMRAKLG